MAEKKKPENKKTKNELLEKWNGRIGSMKNYMRDAGARKKWKEYKQYYLNDYSKALKLKSNVNIVRINMVKSYVRTCVSELYARNPKFKCQPITRKGILPSRIAEQAINYYWYVKKIKRQTRKCLKEAKLIGYSWIKVGYEGEFGSFEDNGVINEYIKSEDIFAVYVPHDAVWYDPLAEDPPHDARWFIHHYLKPTEFLRGKYKNDKIKSTSTISYSDKKESMLIPSDTEMTRVYEIWDKENEQLLMMCDGLDEILEEKPWTYKHADGSLLVPFCMLSFEPETSMEKDDNIPNPEIEDFIDQILEKMKFRSIQVSHIKRFSRQMGVDKNRVNDSETQKYRQGLDGAIIKVDGDPQSALYPIPYAAVQPDIYGIENKIDQDYDRSSRQPGFRAGVSTQTKTRTLGELNMMEESASGSQSEEQDIVEEFTEDVAGKILALIRQYFDEDQYARVTGDVSELDRIIFEKKGMLDGAAIKYNKDTVAGEYDVEIVHGSMLPLNPSSRLNYLMQMARFGPSFGLGPGSLTSMYLGQSIAKEMELKDVERAYDMDMKRLLAPQKPNPKEQLGMISAKQKIDKDAADIKLKTSRIEANQLSNLGKALKNADAMNGKKTRETGDGKR